MKKMGIALGVACVMLFIFIFTYVDRNTAKDVQRGIASRVIRLHVVANSDIKEDQELKIAIKDKIVKNLRSKLSEANNVESARKILQDNLNNMENIAVEEMKKRGYSYSANADLEQSYFPVKSYGDMTFPEGQYEAVKVRLGEANGKNWWCVMYPTLCFVDSTYQFIPEDSKEILKKELTTDEYQLLLRGENITYSFKLLEWVENLFH